MENRQRLNSGMLRPDSYPSLEDTMWEIPIRMKKEASEAEREALRQMLEAHIELLRARRDDTLTPAKVSELTNTIGMLTRVRELI